MARFFLPRAKLQQNRGTIEGQELEHLRRVLRLKSGDRVTVFDDGGWEHEAIILALTAAKGEIEIVRSYETQRESPLRVTLALGLTKGDKMDFVVEKATELGVQSVVPFVSTYAVPKLDDRKIAARTERWRKIALSAAKQCGRVRVPEISPVCSFAELIAQAWPETLKLFFWEKEARQSLRQVQVRFGETSSALLVIGPEGGFSGAEAEAALSRGFEPVQLGRRILRAETAAVTALSVVQFLWGDLS